MAAIYSSFQILLNVVIILFLISFPTVLPASLNFNEGNENQKPHLTRLDIESCNCLPATRNCEVTLSSAVLSGFKCQPGQQYCCSISKNHSDVTESKPPRIHIVLPTATEQVIATVSTQASKNYQCRCKLRNNCPEIYKDYSFSYGYDCTIDKVKCCEPAIEEVTYNGAGRLINVLNKSDKSTENCFCLPKSKCQTKDGHVMRRGSTMCPANLTECCGDAVADKKSDDNFQVDQLDDKNDSLERLDNSPPEIMHRTHHEPIQLPQMKIPPSSPVQDLDLTSTLPPPQLPNKYFSPVASNTNQHDGYVYTPIQTQQQRPSHYYTGNTPWANKYGNSYVINNNGRGFADTQRSSSPSFFSTLASLIG